jgi:GcrA cell cycle regulator
MGWTDEIVKELKALWEKGYTTVEIGKKLGVSKNAVVGKAHRLGLDARPSPIKKSEENENENKDIEKKKTAKTTKTKGKEENKEIKSKTKSAKNSLNSENNSKKEDKEANDSNKNENSIEEEKNSKNKKKIGLVDLTSKTCRWPIGDPKDDDFHFCGKEIAIGEIYCAKHAAIAYTTPTQKAAEKNKKK